MVALNKVDPTIKNKVEVKKEELKELLVTKLNSYQTFINPQQSDNDDVDSSDSDGEP